MRARALVPTRRNRRALVFGALALLGCNLNNPGDEPPPGTIYFPNALALSPSVEGEPPRYLFVANSNFDLRWKAGTVQALSLEALDAAIARCGGVCDEPIEGDELTDLLEDEVRIGSFATALDYAQAPRLLTGAPPGEDVLFVTTRTDDNLRFVRVDPTADGDDVLRCEGDGPSCDLFAGRDIDPDTGDRLDWPPDPAAVESGVLADWLLPGEVEPGSAAEERAASTRYALVAHRGGQASLFVEDPDADFDEDGRFVLAAVLSGLVPPVSGLAFDPETQIAYLASSFGGLSRVEVAVDETGEAAALFRLPPVVFDDASGRPDTRDITFVPGRAGAGFALAENSALVVSFDPAALLLVDVDEQRNDPNSARVKQTAVVGAGASRVSVGTLGGAPVAVVSSFTTRTMFVVDLSTMLTRSIVPNLSGPFDVELDDVRERMYVADFRSSVIRVIDLSELARTQGMASARLVATIGAPRVLQELR